MEDKRVWIENLTEKVTVIFEELKKDNCLCEKKFVEAFPKFYPADYELLEKEWEQKVREYKKNRKGQPKRMPIRPEKILRNMYRNYYFRLITNPERRAKKVKIIKECQKRIKRLDLKIVSDGNGRYNIVNNKTGQNEYEHLPIGEVKRLCFKDEIRKRWKYV